MFCPGSFGTDTRLSLVSIFGYQVISALGKLIPCIETRGPIMQNLLCLSLICVTAFTTLPCAAQSKEPFRVGWISALTGPVAKYGAYEAALLAVDDINRSGGIQGRALELVVEDGKCEGTATASAAQKLIQVDRVQYILGGHCSTETLTLAPIAERNKVVVLASISSSPLITTAGRYIFRTSPISTQQSDLFARYLASQQKFKLALLYEDTSYVGPIASDLKNKFSAQGGEVSYSEPFSPGATDFRAMLTAIKRKSPEAIFVGVQAQDTAQLILRQIHELRIHALIMGNEAAGNAVHVHPNEATLFEGLVFAEPAFDTHQTDTSEFIERYKQTFKTNALPYGFWTAEAYDGVRLLADVLNRCGTNPEESRVCLEHVRNYRGVSGVFSMDENGDAIRKYQLKTVRDGLIQNILQ